MNHQCPACKKSLRFKLVKSKAVPGTGRMEGFTYCPYCKTSIHYNQHPAEKRAGIIISMAVTLLAITMAIHNSTLIYIAFIILSVVIVASLYIVFSADSRDTPRWILHEQSNDSLDC